MAERKIGGKLVIDGEAEFRANLASAKTALSAVQSELKLVTAKFKNNADSLEALNARQQVYIKLQAEQKNKASLLVEMQEKVIKKLDAEKSTLADLVQKRERLSSELENAKAVYGENSEEVKKLADELDAINEQYEVQERVVRKTSDRANTYQRDINNVQIELEELNAEIAENERRLDDAGASSESTTDAVEDYSHAVDECADTVDETTDAVSEFGDEIQDSADKTSVFGDVLKAELLSSAITEGIKKLADGIYDIAKSATDTGMTFEAAMSQVAATMGITTSEIATGSEAYETLNAAAQECGKSTMYSASQAADALNYLALAGYDAEKAAATLPKVLNLAAAGGLDLQYAADLVTDSMAAMGMETYQLDNYIDQMAKTSQKSNTSVAQLGEATLVCAGTVSLTGQSLKTMNTALGVMANNGIKSAEGGTHLRNILLSLSAPTDTASVAMQELGLRVSDSNGNMRDLNDILIDMNKQMSGMSTVQKTQMISKIFNKTDIAAVNSLLKSTNGEWDALYGNISNCNGAAQDMADTMNDNLKGKITILESALEGLSISAYNVFDENMKSAVDAATNAVGELQDAVDNGELGVSLSRMSDALGEFAENAIGTAQQALPGIIDGFTWILENGELLAGLIGGITTAKIAYTTATKSAEIAQKLFNITANANPYIMLATAIGGVIGAVTLYAKTADNETLKLSRSTETLIDASKTLNDEFAAAGRRRNENKASMDAEAQVCRELVSELESLQRRTSLTAEEQARQTAIIDQLNQVMPELNLYIDDQTGKLNMTTEALKKNVDAQLEMMRIEAAREDLTDIAKEQYEAEKKLIQLKADYEEAAERCREAQAKMTDEMERYKVASRESEEAWQIAANDCNALVQQIDEATKSFEDLGLEYNNVSEYISRVDAIQSAATAIKKIGDAALGTGSCIETMSDEAIAAYNEMCESLSETVSEQINLFDKFNGKAELSTQELLDNMQSQVDGVTMWSENLQELSGRMDELEIGKGLLQHLADMGPQGAGYVATFASMTDDELKKASELFQESLLLPSAAANITDSYMTAGVQASEGYNDGLASGVDVIKTTASAIADMSINELNGVPKQTAAIGGRYDEGLISGINGKQNEVLKTVGLLTAKIAEKTKSEISESKYKKIGWEIPEGLLKGLNEGQAKVISGVNSLCTSMLNAARKALDIHSPSKKFAYLGEMSGEGYISGWQDSMAGVDEIINESLPDIDGLYDSAMEKAREQMNLFEEFGSSTKISTEEILKNMESQVTGVTQWADSLNELAARGIDQGLLQHLADMGPQGAAYLAAFVDMTDEELQRANQLFEQSGLTESIDKVYESIKEKVSGQISLFEKFNSEQKLSTEEMLSNMQSQITGVSQWADNIAILSARGINQGLLQNLADMGPQGAGYVSTFVDMTDEELQRANQLFEQSLVLPESTARLVSSSYSNAGTDAAKGFEDGILSEADSVDAAAGEIAQGALDTVKEVLEIQSPSKKMEGLGKYYDEGLGSGIKSGKNVVINEAKQLVTKLLTETKKGVPFNKYEAIGMNITEGLRSGIESGRSGVIESIKDLCTDAITAARNTLDIHSPSRAFSFMGEMSGEGYISGWRESMSNIDGIIADSLPDTSVTARSGNVTGMMETITAMSARNDRVASICGEIVNIISRYLPQMANMQVVTDTGVLAGQLAPKIDKVLGGISNNKRRGMYE